MAISCYIDNYVITNRQVEMGRDFGDGEVGVRGGKGEIKRIEMQYVCVPVPHEEFEPM